MYGQNVEASAIRKDRLLQEGDFENLKIITTPKFNSEFTPEKRWDWEDDPFLLGFGNFSGANC